MIMSINIKTEHLPQLGTRFGLDGAASSGVQQFEGEIVCVSGHRGGVSASDGVLVPSSVLVQTPLPTRQARTLGAGPGTQGVALILRN